MIAYFVHQADNNVDHIVLPDMGCAVRVTPDAIRQFIAVNPEFTKWTGDACDYMEPDAFGDIIATRTQGEDVCILKNDLWRERLLHYLPPQKPPQ